MSEYTPRRLDVLEAFAAQAKFFSDRGFDKTVETVRRYAYDAAVNTLLANRIGVTDERFKTALRFYKSICRLCSGDTGRSAVRLFLRRIRSIFFQNFCSDSRALRGEFGG